MTELHELSAIESVAKIKSGDLKAEQLVRSCLERIEERDSLVRAWSHLDKDKVIAEAVKSDKAGNPGPLSGLPVAVKDIMDTSDMPTTYGSTIYGGHQPSEDADCVKNVRGNGGIIIGKTVTTEFAWRNPGKTRNPHNTKHTPGGSSSGSAASVADMQVPLAFGTQTAGSVIRPAAYCGVVGYKPTFGTHNRKGVKELSAYLDTVGTFGRNVSDVSFFDYVLRGKKVPDLSYYDNRPPVIGLMIPFRIEANEEALTAYEGVYKKAEKAGASLIDIPSSMSFESLADLQTVIMTGDAGKSLSWEYEHHPERLIRFYRDSIATGRAIGESSLKQSKQLADDARTREASIFKKVDIILTLPAGGEAPEGIGFTGDPLFNRVWTLLGWPCISLPVGFGPGGLPLGVQIVGSTGEDARALAGAAWLEKVLTNN